MAARIEEEEFADNEGFYKHDGACCDDGQKAHDVEDSNGIEDHIAWTGQFLKEPHCAWFDSLLCV